MIETDKDYFLGLEQTVTTAIQEDLGSGDVTVELIDMKMQANRLRESSINIFENLNKVTTT